MRKKLRKRPKPFVFKRKDAYTVEDVLWLDAYSNSEYLDDGDVVPQGMVMHDVGFLAAETPDTITLVSCITDTGRGRRFMQIPKSWVLERRVLFWQTSKARKRKKS